MDFQLLQLRNTPLEVLPLSLRSMDTLCLMTELGEQQLVLTHLKDLLVDHFDHTSAQKAPDSLPPGKLINKFQ